MNSNGVGVVLSKKRKARRILRPDEKQKSKETIAVGLPPFERFYAGLLRSEANEYLGKSREVWKIICDRLALTIPTDPVAPSYSNMKDHFSVRAALVIEEARQSLADNIKLLKEDFENHTASHERRHGQNRNKPFVPRHAPNRQSYRDQHSFPSMELSITRVEHKGNSGHSILTFCKKSAPLTKVEILNLRQGTVFSCLDRNASDNIENILLGVILPQSREEMANSNAFVLMVFRKIKKTIKGTWKLTPIISLLSEQRKFEACINQMATPVPFLLPLLGMKKPSHLHHFEDHIDHKETREANEKRFEEDDAESGSDCEILEIVDLEATFQIPRLNTMQEIAAHAFLKSKSDTITLVQGPPGTGKTTLLTSVICRYIIESRKLEHNKRCLMVCAPTNKAVTVLCSRFLNTFLDDESYPCNVVLLGDEDKLLENEIRSRENTHFENHKLRESFLYTFIDTIESDYLYIRKTLDKGSVNLNRILKIARRLENLLTEKITDEHVVGSARSIVKLIEKFSNLRNKRYPTEIINKLDLIIGMIVAWNRDDIFHELLQRADVIFCTLGSSGSSLLRKVIGEVDDLIVDEAAAATEPEIYIPFQFLPRRLLCVGDPKQLPATITSQFAEKMGLSKSLHERLMYDCKYGHIMLDTQYRMKPALSEFPSKNFYEGKLINGGNVIRSKYNGGVSMMNCDPYTLFQVNGNERQVRSGSIENEAEANVVVEIVDDLRRISHSRSRNWCSPNRLRIITFYQAQVSLIKRMLRRRNLGNVLVATVDSSQGCEADFVIVSFVRSEGKHERNTVGFVADDRRLNVALTRAKYQMICVGNIERMATLTGAKAESVKRLAIDAMNRKSVQPFKKLGSKRNMSHDHVETMNKKRKPSHIEMNQNFVGGRQKPIENLDMSSSCSSDAESSTVSSSSVSSDSTSSDSSSRESKLPEPKAGNPKVQSNSVCSAVIPNPAFEATNNSVPVKDEPVVNNENRPLNDDNEYHLQRKPTKDRRKIEEESNISNNLDVAPSNGTFAPENAAQAKHSSSSMLSKTETMAVFEDFSF